MTRTNADLGRLLLRLTLGFCVLFHGIAKIQGGVEGIAHDLIALGLPGFIAYGVYVGEVLAPVMLILGFYSRLGAVLVAINMVFALGIAHRPDILKISQYGGWAIELQAMYLITAIAPLINGTRSIRDQRPVVDL
jgi:putative oxidoreductase